jgi:hypothetical protein
MAFSIQYLPFGITESEEVGKNSTLLMNKKCIKAKLQKFDKKMNEEKCPAC